MSHAVSRSHRRTTAPLAALVLCLSAVLAGCGGSSAKDPDDVNTEVAAPPNPSGVETFAGQGLSMTLLDKLTKAMTAALASGDEKAFLSHIAPGHPRLLAQQRAWFRNVRAMPLASRKLVAVQSKNTVDSSGKGVLTTDVGFSHQFRGADARPLVEWYEWGFQRKGDALTITSIGGAKAEQRSGQKFTRYYHQVWDDQNPVTWVGDDKVILVGPSADRGGMQRLLPTLSRSVADQLAVVRATGVRTEPDLYTRRWVFTLASPQVRDLFDYFGGRVNPTEANFAGYTVELFSSQANAASLDYEKGPLTSRVVLSRTMLSASGSDLSTIVRHEMTHAVQQGWDENATSKVPTWLTEGLAVYLSHPGSGETGFRAAAGRRALGGLTTMPDGGDFYSGNDDRVAGNYGVGYLAASYLASKRGEKGLLALVRQLSYSFPRDAFEVMKVPEKTFVKDLKAWAAR